jgi:hypothetical protein
MMHIADTSAIRKRTQRAKWSGYAACAWALIFALMHLYWGIEVATTGTLTVPDRTLTGLPRGNNFAWVIYIGILCVLGILVAFLRFRGERMSRRTQMSLVAVAAAALSAYVAYTFVVNGFLWLLAPGVLCAVGSIIALALIQPWGHIIPRWLLLLSCWVGGVILIVHELYGGLTQCLAVFGVISWQQLLKGSLVTPASMTVQRVLLDNLIWGTWFLLGGILFCTLAWLARRQVGQHQQ